MCETLQLMRNLPSNSAYETPIIIETHVTKEIDRCEPDNGSKSETTAPATKQDLKLEEERLKTFRNWNVHQVITGESLAKSGFYSICPTSDLVKCAFCNAEICRWEVNDDPMDEHEKWSPNCPFVREKRGNSTSYVINPLPAGQDVCGTGELFPNSMPEDQQCKLLLKKIISSYQDFRTRLDTFTDWPKSLKQKPAILAEAGFYYKGVGDQTVCFECSGGLKDWEENDDPWEQHALWFPKCKFLLSSKGQEFIDEVKRKLTPDNELIPKSLTKEPELSEAGASAHKDDNSKLCKICFNNLVEVVFIPCGHLLACLECSVSLKDKNCPVCRKRFDLTMRVFSS